MFKRKKLNRKKSRRSFTKGALRTRKENFRKSPMRGGIRF